MHDVGVPGPYQPVVACMNAGDVDDDEVRHTGRMYTSLRDFTDGRRRREEFDIDVYHLRLKEDLQYCTLGNHDASKTATRHEQT